MAPELWQDTSPADWLVARLTTFAVDVGSLVPEGFAAYARLFHPAARRGPTGPEPVRWADVAAASGRVAHAEMQWEALTGSELHQGDSEPGVWDDEPEVGALPLAWAPRLARILGAHSTRPDTVWFCVWDGFGGLDVDPTGAAVLRRRGWRTVGYGRRRLRRVRGRRPGSPPAPKVELPNRSYYLFKGEVGDAAMSFGQHWISANLWWPDDRSWCVATEIDLASTYVAGSQTAIDAVLADPVIEAMPADARHGITQDSDRHNRS